ncbi:MAG: LCP family protein [Oscillospiraceae bacterium]|nr:LCP family protein [Oscillospiraceae bacterium]
MKKGRKIALIAVGTVLILCVAAVGILVGYGNSKLNKIDYDYNDGKLTEEEQQQVVQHVEEMDDDPQVQAQVEEIEAVFEEEEIEVVETPPPVDPRPELEIIHDDNVINILLIGTDERTEGFSAFARGDSCMILSLNKSTGRAKLVSLERGMGVPILDGQYKGYYDWLTHTFCYGGADLMMREVRECFRVEVDRYIRVNFGTFRAGINSIGGIDVNLTQAEADYLMEKDPGTEVTEGLNHLYGFTALQYARCRGIDSDWMRIRRQRTVIQAAINKTKGLSIGELDNMLNKVLPLVRTNLSKGEIVELMTLAPKFQGVTLEQMTIPASGTYGGMRGMGGRSLYAVDFYTNAVKLREFLYG